MKRRLAVPDRGHVHERRGASTSGHIHVFTGGGLGGIIPGTPPSSSANMWNTLPNLENYDVSLWQRDKGGESSFPRTVRRCGEARVPVALPRRVTRRPSRYGCVRRLHCERRPLGAQPSQSPTPSLCASRAWGA
jgi:hypothetical protein